MQSILKLNSRPSRISTPTSGTACYHESLHNISIIVGLVSPKAHIKCVAHDFYTFSFMSLNFNLPLNYVLIFSLIMHDYLPSFQSQHPLATNALSEC